MERYVMRKLVEWRDSPRRKPLLLNGARQVGKTWLLRELGKQHFDSYAEVNLDTSPRVRAQFESGYDLPRILQAIQIETGLRVESGKTLLVLDEIQECPQAVTSLKYFADQMPDLAVAGAGSLLGLTFHQGTGFPVGKVRFIDVYPLCFGEYLDAVGQTQLRRLAEDGDAQMVASFAPEFERHLRDYFFVGGMPEAASAFVERADYHEAREIQEEILRGYTMDISKHMGGAAAECAIAAWNSIPAHLSRENKRFVFSHISGSRRARDYHAGITWLENAGIATKVPRVSKPGIPLKSYERPDIFKLFVVDIGLLGAMARLDVDTLLNGNAIFEEFKGTLTEQFVFQELVSFWGERPCYWSASNSQTEVDFLAQHGSSVFVIEVKGAENLYSRSLRSFVTKYPHARALRLSLAGFRVESWMANVPLYAVESPRCWKLPPAGSSQQPDENE